MASAPETSQIAIVCAATPIHLVLALRPLGGALRVIDGAGTATAELSDQAVDVVVVEHDGRLDGLGLVAALRGEPDHAETPIVLIVAAEGGPSRRDCVDAGATDVVLAPYDRCRSRCQQPRASCPPLQNQRLAGHPPFGDRNHAIGLRAIDIF